MKAYLFLWAMICTLAVSGQSSVSSKADQAYQYALQLKLDSARALIHSSPPTGYFGYLLNLTNTTELLITESPTQFHLMKKTYDSLSNAIDDSTKEPFRSFYLSEMQLQWSLVFAKFGEEFNAGWSLRSAYRKAEKVCDDYPEFIESKKTLGLLEVLIGSVPDKYQWIMRLLGMRGNVQNGLQYLSMVAESDESVAFEARGIIAVLDSYLLHKESEAASILRNMRSEDPNNLLVHYLLVSALIKDHQGLEALNEIESFPYSGEHINLPFMEYIKGELYLQSGAYDKSILHYEKFISEHPGENYIKDSYYKLFIAHWLKGEIAQAEEMRQVARESGVMRVEADKHAARRLQEKEYPNKDIMKIRMFTDGGYYSEADSLVQDLTSSPNLLNPSDNTELIYRRARILHQTNMLEEAKKSYKQVIELSEGESWYFGPNSALQIGYIYMDEGSTAEAIKYFEMAQDFPKHEYSNSINNKAKAALKALEE